MISSSFAPYFSCPLLIHDDAFRQGLSKLSGADISQFPDAEEHKHQIRARVILVKEKHCDYRVVCILIPPTLHPVSQLRRSVVCVTGLVALHKCVVGCIHSITVFVQLVN